MVRQTSFKGAFYVLPLVIGLALVSPLQAQVWEGNVSSDWSDGANWAGGVAPPGTTTLTVINVSNSAVVDGINATNSNQGLVIGQTTTGAMLTVANGGKLTVPLGFVLTPTLVVGANAGASGSVVVRGAGSALNLTSAFGGAPFIGQSGSGTLTLSDGGLFSVSSSVGIVNVAAQTGSKGTLNVGAAEGDAAVGAGMMIAPGGVKFGAGDGRLVFNHTDSNYLFGTALSGNGAVDLLAGTTAFTTNSTGFTGTVQVHDGAVMRAQGAATRTLGSGANGTVTVLEGGRLAVTNASDVLSVGNLNLEDGSALELSLGLDGENAIGTSLTVRGDVNLEGAELYVNDLGEFANGEWTLIRFDGALNVDWSMTAASLPGGLTGEVRIGDDGQSLVLVVGDVVLEESWWAAGAAFGGSGVWDNSTANWTDETGTVDTVWGEQVAVFAGSEAGTVTVTEAVVFTGLRIETDGYLIDAEGDAALVAAADITPIIEVVGAGTGATLAVSLVSDNGLRKEGQGTLVLSTDQQYSGTTTVAGGTLQLGNGGSAGLVAGAVNIQQQGTLAFDRADDISFDQLISGTGRLLHRGEGTTLLTRDNVYTGRTVIESGTLQLGASVAGGATSGWMGSSEVELHDGATLVINRADSRTLSAVLSGAGTLVQRGNGPLSLSGNSGGFGGLTRVDGGSLRITSAATLGGDLRLASGTTAFVDGTLGGDADIHGSLHLANQIGGSADIRGGGLLTGSGSITGSLRVHQGGRLSLLTITDSAGGDDTPSLHVGGDLIFAEGAGFEVGANRFGNADWVEVAGQAELAGTVLVVEAGDSGAAWQPFNEYRILTAVGGLVGQFEDEVQNNFAFLDPQIHYDGNVVRLSLDRSDVRFGELPGLSPNQQATGAAIQSIEGLVGQNVEHPVVQALLPLSVAQARVALHQLSGELHASARSVLLHDTAMVQDAVMAHAGSAANPGSRFWTRGLYHEGRFKDGGTAKLERNTTGLLLGADYLMGSHAFTLGWAVGYHRSEVDAPELHARSNINAAHAAIYSGARWGMEALPWSLPGGDSLGVRLGVSHSWHEIDLHRTVEVLGETLSSRYDATSLQAALELDARFRFADNELAPFLSAAWVSADADGFVEDAGDTQPVLLGETAALQGASSQESLTLATLGVRGAFGFGKEVLSPLGERLRLTGMLGWRSVLSGDVPETRMRLRDNAPGAEYMTIEGTPLASNALIADLGLTLGFESGSLGLSWVGQIASEARDNAVQARFEWLLE